MTDHPEIVSRGSLRPCLTAGLALGLLTAALGGCLSSPEIVPPPPVEQPPLKIDLPPGALPPPDGYDRRLYWDYARLNDNDLVKCYAGESDLARDVRFRPPTDPQRSGTVDLLVKSWARPQPPPAHLRAALVRLLAELAPTDARTHAVLLAALDDEAMQVRFRANTRLSELFSTDVSYDPNETDPVVRTSAIARWKQIVEAAAPAPAPARPAAPADPELDAGLATP